MEKNNPQAEEPVPSEPAAANNEEGEGSDQEEKELTSEEQMALYEKSLKEDDWGHQPC